MTNQLMAITGTLRVFDGYDRWEKFPYQQFGSKEELDVLKNQLERPLHSPLFNHRQYINLEIRVADEQEITQYKKQLEAQLHQNEEEYQNLLQNKQRLSKSIQEDKEKIKQLEKLKIPY